MPGAPVRTFVERLVLTDFRNHHATRLDLGPGCIVVTGENGAGKTNLLEAVSLLSPGRGLRRTPFVEAIRAGAPAGFAVHARIVGAEGEAEIGTGYAADPPGTDAVRRIRINGANARSADDLLDWLRVIWLTPSMDALFTGPAADRRRFLDRLVLTIDPQHGRRALDYEKAMRSRNRLLSDDVRDDRWFTAIEAQMAETGTAIAAARSELVALVAGLVERLPDDGPFPKSTLALSGYPEQALADAAALDVEEDFRRRLAEGRGRDAAAGRTLEGPHRSDLLVTHRPKSMPAELCSTGEQKALLVGLILAQARLTADLAGMTPILLLDEIAAHFDAGRRAALFDILMDLGCQAFMTGTEPALFASLAGRARFVTVAGGAATVTDRGNA